ncbi:MAG: UvrD-helicase domain-containing protein, partial [Chloroflexi bacterium]|nr:UvrD-helicase domain-containing protein [Chloroflexota bacterium]
MNTPSDQPARDAIVERLDENMVVEAGAGTGKTRSLVDRVVALITTGRASVGGIAAITFTESAAAELRSRIGETLERTSSDPSRGEAERERCKRALGDLDQASFQTLHSFASSLLRERPLEAGLPPGFNVRDGIEAEVAFEKEWAEWLDATLDDPEAQEALRPALTEGVTLRQMREIAISFHRNYDLLADVSFDSPSEQDKEGERERELAPVLQLLRKFSLRYADERKSAGDVEFQDLLVLARDLLRDSIPARDHFRGRYSHILIDEVQDTDPLQAEIAFFLAEHAPDGTISPSRPKDWRNVRPAAGKLFIVGDPKQSIYRFRRADIQQVDQMRKACGGSNALLTQNFRSLPPVIEWVNHVFEQWMEGGESQADYSPLDAVSELGEPSPVRHIGGVIEGNVGDVRWQEADAIAGAIGTAIAEGWEVRSLDRAKEPRPAKYQDICVLMPSRLGLDALEFALETAGIPYRLD